MNRYIKKHELKFLAYPKSKPRKRGKYFVLGTDEIFQIPFYAVAWWMGKDGWDTFEEGKITVHAWATLPDINEFKELLQLED